MATTFSYHQGLLSSTLMLSPQASGSPGRQPFWTLHDHRSRPLAHHDGHLFPAGHTDPQVRLGIAYHAPNPWIQKTQQQGSLGAGVLGVLGYLVKP